MEHTTEKLKHWHKRAYTQLETKVQGPPKIQVNHENGFSLITYATEQKSEELCSSPSVTCVTVMGWESEVPQVKSISTTHWLCDLMTLPLRASVAYSRLTE